MRRYRGALASAAVICCLLFMGLVVQAAPANTDETSVLAEYEDYYDRFMSIENRGGIAGGGFRVVEDHYIHPTPAAKRIIGDFRGWRESACKDRNELYLPVLRQ